MGYLFFLSIDLLEAKTAIVRYMAILAKQWYFSEFRQACLKDIGRLGLKAQARLGLMGLAVLPI
jgi:hypothetical protein